MKHLLQQQQAGGPGSPPASKCHDRLPLVIAMALLQKAQGHRKSLHQHQASSPCTLGLAHICTSPPSCCCPHTGRSQCRQGGQQGRWTWTYHIPLHNAGSVLPHVHNPQALAAGGVSHFQKAVQIPSCSPH